MNLAQLRAICEVVRQGMNVSAAAAALFKAQPGISRQIREIEDELGIQVFHRQKNRICGLTPAGEDLLQVAHRMLLDADNLRAIGKEHTLQDSGDLVIATTHTHARYSLPPVIEQFSKSFPKVKLTLRQASPMDACDLVARGSADMAICTELPKMPLGLVSFPMYRVTWDVMAAADHPILKQRPITLERIARYPIITQTFSGGRVITDALTIKGHAPNVLLTGADAEVSKAYVERRLGLAILAEVAYEPGKDSRLRLLGVRHLFEPSILTMSIRIHNYLRSYTIAFISRYAPHLSIDLVSRAVSGRKVDLLTARKRLPILTTSR